MQKIVNPSSKINIEVDSLFSEVFVMKSKYSMKNSFLEVDSFIIFFLSYVKGKPLLESNDLQKKCNLDLTSHVIFI